MNQEIVLEKEALAVARDNAKPPLIFQLPPEQGREALEKAQSSYIQMYPSTVQYTYIDTKGYGSIRVFIVNPSTTCPKKKVIFYTHGAGWVFGSFHTHEKLVRELAYRTNSILIFPEYDRAPEAVFPKAVYQCYSVLCQIPTLVRDYGINSYTLLVAGDSVGGGLATAMTILAKYEKGPEISKQLLFYPVTNDDFNTPSYQKYASGYYLYKEGMEWFWNQYVPNREVRNSILISPLKASLEQLHGLPSAMILNGEVDVLHDEGVSYAKKLRKAGNDVTSICFEGMIHDFVMLNALDTSNATRAAMNVAVDWINGTGYHIQN